jgi:hypothetical protein
LADLGDRQALTANQAIRRNVTALQDLALRYDVDTILVAVADPAGPGRVSVRVTSVRWLPDGNTQSGQFRVSGDGNDAGTGITALTAAYERARLALIGRMEAEWKQKAIVRSGAETRVRLTALYSSIAQWRRIREALAKSPLVREARLDALSADGALMTLTYVGAREQLARQLSESGVELSDTDIGPVARLR